MAGEIDLTPIASGVLNGGIVIGGIAFGGVVLIMLFMVWRGSKKFDFTTIEFVKDAFGRPMIEFGKGGIYTDKKVNYKRFYLQGKNASLSADKIPYIKSPKNKYVFLRKIGAKNYEYLSFEEIFTQFPKINIGEEDINSAIIDFDRAKQTFGQTLWDKILPYIPLILTGVFMVGMVYLIMKDLPTLLGQMQQIANKLGEVAELLSKQQTTIVK